MAQFNRDFIEVFLGAVRKYMQVRGPMNQKELAVLTDTGVSTMSRFLNQKTTELNPQLIAKIVAKLEIPLHEIIDFVDEEYGDKFVKLVRFYKDESSIGFPAAELLADDAGGEDGDEIDDVVDAFSSLGTAERTAKAKVKVGGKTRSIPFNADSGTKNTESSIREKLESLSPRQKAYLTDFLNLDVEGKDLMVDLGNSLFRYFKQKGMEF